MFRKPYFWIGLIALGLIAYLAVKNLLSIPQYEQLQSVAPPYSASLADDALWVSLFNGKDLDGWTAKITGHSAGTNFADTYRVEDGAITVNYADYEVFDNSFGNLFYKTPFSHYVLRMEYRFIGEQATDSLAMFWAWRNSGVMVHSQAPESMLLDQWFPASIEVQLLGAKEGEHRSTANLCTPATNVVLYGSDDIYTPHCTNSLSQSYSGDQWVTVEIEVWGSEKIRHFVNGKLVMEYRAPQLDASESDAEALLKDRIDGDLLLSEGYIALQSESHPVQFRQIELHQIQQ
jgi:hypothetical protein